MQLNITKHQLEVIIEELNNVKWYYTTYCDEFDRVNSSTFDIRQRVTEIENIVKIMGEVIDREAV